MNIRIDPNYLMQYSKKKQHRKEQEPDNRTFGEMLEDKAKMSRCRKLSKEK